MGDGSPEARTGILKQQYVFFLWSFPSQSTLHWKEIWCKNSFHSEMSKYRKHLQRKCKKRIEREILCKKPKMVFSHKTYSKNVCSIIQRQIGMGFILNTFLLSNCL